MYIVHLKKLNFLNIFQLAGLIYRNNMLWVQKYLFFPHALGSLCNSALGSIFSTPPPAELNTRMGATLEIQRSVHMEQLERQLIWGQLNNQQRPQVGVSSHFYLWELYMVLLYFGSGFTCCANVLVIYV